MENYANLTLIQELNYRETLERSLAQARLEYGSAGGEATPSNRRVSGMLRRALCRSGFLRGAAFCPTA